jgi:hypothetical protein
MPWRELMNEPLVLRPYLVPTIVAICAFFFGLSLLRRKNLPPGPRRLPLIGNVHQLPVQSPWITFGEWSKKYGEYQAVCRSVNALTTLKAISFTLTSWVSQLCWLTQERSPTISWINDPPSIRTGHLWYVCTTYLSTFF